jgi:hypothetical protein
MTSPLVEVVVTVAHRFGVDRFGNRLSDESVSPIRAFPGCLSPDCTYVRETTVSGRHRLFSMDSIENTRSGAPPRMTAVLETGPAHFDRTVVSANWAAAFQGKRKPSGRPG